MFEKALKGSRRYYLWIGFLLIVICCCSSAYIYQLMHGLTVTGMSRDVSWGFYIAQFTYLVGVAASGVMIVLPFYFHNYEEYRHMVVFGEFMAIAAVLMCMCFIVVDLGQPQRMLNMIIHPTPNSILFWDMNVLVGYLLLNVLVGWTNLERDRQHLPHPTWTKVLAIISVIWAFSIHTVTAFLYQGLPSRHYWLDAIMAARFLASAFCSGPAILLLVLFVTQKVTNFRMSTKALATLTKTIAYAMCVNVFFFLLEIFTSYYSNIPDDMASMTYLFSGIYGHSEMVPFMWLATVCGLGSIVLLVTPQFRNNRRIMPWALAMLILATWIDKGLSMLVAGFNPNCYNEITPYWPTGRELIVSLMIYAIGALAVTVLFKIATDVWQELDVCQKEPPAAPSTPAPALQAEEAKA